MNLKYLLVSALLGGLASFVWGAVYHAAIGIDEKTMTEFRDSTSVSQYLREHAGDNGMFYTREGVLAAISMTPGMNDKSQNMGPQLVKQYIINAVTAGLLAWLLLFTSIRSPLGAGGVLAIAGLAAGIDGALSSWNWYNHSLCFALAAIVDMIACFFVAGLVIGWARRRFSPVVL